MQSSNEVWKPIQKYPGYEASSLGRVRSADRKVPNKWGTLTSRKGKILKQRHRDSGHLRVNLSVAGKHMTVHVHQLVMLAFRGEPAPGFEVCHNDGDPSNNRLDNLRYGTASDNIQDMIRHGVHPLASRTHCPKGHPFDEGNTWHPPRGNSYRRCRKCDHQAYINRKIRLGITVN